ncbi:MFS transporter [Falsiroseomonas oryziterrae]|uniref:MFS transporter n=1 Tax=Falsiroseomonas oryziterrae TaxID=2911368 RepID=UPI001F02503A|nr:MFS transporter [Roseomonas sp. NPKOSM-4]
MSLLTASSLGPQVVLGAFLVTLVGFGAIYSYSAFAEDIAAEFGSSRSTVTLVFVLSGSACFFVSAVSGVLADRVGPRVLAAAGMVLVGIGLLVAATAKTLIEVYVGYGLLIGLGTGFAYVPALAAVQRWFVVHRGLASGIAVSGVGIGTAIVPPAAEALAMLGDWRVAFVVCSVLAVAVGLAGAALLHPTPERFGFGPDGHRLDPDAAQGRPPTPVLEVIRSRAFVLAYGGTLLIALPVALPYALLVATARDLGVSRHDALALLALIGLGSIAGRFALAALADAIGRRLVFLGCCAGLAAGTIGWAAADSLAQFQAFALIFGALQGGFVALLPAFVADRFGRGAVGSVLGVLYTSRGVALLIGPSAVALGVAAFAGHALPLAVVGMFGGIGTVMLARVGRGA